jgi:hypothetical protein
LCRVEWIPRAALQGSLRLHLGELIMEPLFGAAFPFLWTSTCVGLFSSCMLKYLYALFPPRNRLKKGSCQA